MENDLIPQIAPSNAVATVEVALQREMAEVQAAMAMAKRFPRNQKEALDRILMACQRHTLAEGALYSYSRGGTEITGPSIRLAEAIAQNWGNFQFGLRELEQRTGESTVEAYAWDLESNTRQVKVFQVKHVRKTRARGTYLLDDPRDIYEMVANQGARRMRACILGVIPGDVVEAAVKQCEETLRSKIDLSPDAIQKMVLAFQGLGVSKEMIEARIQRRLDTITSPQVIALRKIYNSLKDGMSVVTDWFQNLHPAETGKPGTEGSEKSGPTEGNQAEQLAAELASKITGPAIPEDIPENEADAPEEKPCEIGVEKTTGAAEPEISSFLSADQPKKGRVKK